jgi:hypothetical protein
LLFHEQTELANLQQFFETFGLLSPVTNTKRRYSHSTQSTSIVMTNIRQHIGNNTSDFHRISQPHWSAVYHHVKLKPPVVALPSYMQ